MKKLVSDQIVDYLERRGVEYLLICADDGVEVNGIQVDLDE